MAGYLGKPKPLHEFAKSFKDGIIAEVIVTKYLESDGYTVLPVKQTNGQNKGSGDLMVFREDVCNNHSFGIEVKCDARAETTGNFFLETSVVYDDHRGVTPGWTAYTLAKYVFFYMPTDNFILATTPSRIRNRLPKWNKMYFNNAKAYNRSGNSTWQGVGTLVPVDCIRGISKEILLDHDYRRR